MTEAAQPLNFNFFLTPFGNDLITAAAESGFIFSPVREVPMKSMTRLMIAASIMFALTALRPAHENVKATNLGEGSQFKGKTTEMKDKGEVAYVLSFAAGKEFEATTDGTKNTDVHLYVYDATGKEVGKDESPGPKCSVKVTPEKDGKYKFVIENAGGNNSVTFEVKVAN
jgi:hypothetical protein